MDEVIHATRTALRAKFCGITCVSPFYSLERGVNNIVSLVVVTPKISLRTIIGNRAKMEKHGQKIVIRLIEALKELVDDDFFIRRIQPHSIRLDENFKNLVFCDLRNAITRGELGTCTYGFFEPYNCSLEYELSRDKKDDVVWDMYAIGAVILEIIVGTEIIIMIKSYADMKKLVNLCANYIDEETVKVLKSLLQMGEHENFMKYLNDVLTPYPNIIAENIRAMDMAIEEEPVLKNTVTEFWKEIEKEKTQLYRQKWGVHKDII